MLGVTKNDVERDDDNDGGDGKLGDAEEFVVVVLLGAGGVELAQATRVEIGGGFGGAGGNGVHGRTVKEWGGGARGRR